MGASFCEDDEVGVGKANGADVVVIGLAGQLGRCRPTSPYSTPPRPSSSSRSGCGVGGVREGWSKGGAGARCFGSGAQRLRLLHFPFSFLRFPQATPRLVGAQGVNLFMFCESCQGRLLRF